jgi:hypothetical protein
MEDKYKGAIIGALLGEFIGIQTHGMNPTMTDGFIATMPSTDVCAVGFKGEYLKAAMKLLNNGEWSTTNFAKAVSELGVTADSFISSIVRKDIFVSDPHAAVVAFHNEINKSIGGNHFLTLGIFAANQQESDAENMINEALGCFIDDPNTMKYCVSTAMIVHSIVHDKDVESVYDEYGVDGVKELDNVWSQKLDNIGLSMISMNPMIAYKSCIYALRVIIAAKRKGLQPKLVLLLTAIAKKCGSGSINCAIAGAIVGAYIGANALPEEANHLLDN